MLFFDIWKLYWHMTIIKLDFLRNRKLYLLQVLMIKTEETKWLDLVVYRVLRGVNWLLSAVVFLYIYVKYSLATRSVQVAEWLALLALDQEVSGSNPAGGRSQLWLYGASLHRAFHYHPSVISIWLKWCWKGCKIPKPSASLITKLQRDFAF